MRGLITKIVRKGAISQVMAQGIGRHSKQERYTRFERDIQSIEILLGDQLYLFGETPTAADISVITALRFIIAFPHQNDLSDFIMSKPNLMAYLERGKERLYPK